MKKIAIIIPKLNGGGAERIAGLLSVYLSGKYEVFLFLEDTRNIVYEYKGTIVDMSIDGLENIERSMKTLKEKHQIDCAISFLEPFNFMNIRTKGKEKVIISERCSQSPLGNTNRGQHTNIRRLYNYADEIVTVAYGVEYDLVHNFGIDSNKITTIYNFVNQERLLEKASQAIDFDIQEFKGNSKLILNIGRLQEQKNQKKLIIQVKKLVNDGLDVKLIILGMGNKEPELRKLVKDLELEQHVKILTFQKNPFPFYRYASIFALTSDYEGLPNVLIESMMFEVPIVAVDCLSGPRELLLDTQDYQESIRKFYICPNGILVENVETDTTGKTIYYKEAMKTILTNEELMVSISNNEKKYMAKYSNKKILEQWIQVIEKPVCIDSQLKELHIEELDNLKSVIVYGCGFIGKQVMKDFLLNKQDLDLLCYAVSKKNGQEDNIDDISVYEIEELLEYKENAIVLIGVSEKYENEVIDKLEKLGFHYEFPYIKPNYSMEGEDK